MSNIVHEVWVMLDEDGSAQHACIIAGSLGKGARELLEAEGFEFKYSFVATNHVDAMTKYHKKIHNEIYTTERSDPWDSEPYPSDWAEKQRRDGIKLSNFI